MYTTEVNNVYRQPLYCPQCKHILQVKTGEYFCEYCNQMYPIVAGIPSFVDQNMTFDSFEASSFEFLFQMEQRHFWHVGRREIILDVLRRNIPNLGRSRMLEIGCGNGSVLAFLKQNGIDIEGGDIFLEALNFCRKRAGSVALYQIDILALPFSDEFDIIGAFDVLEHIENDEKALAEINIALKERGYLILTVPAHKFLWSRHDVASHHRRRYSKAELLAKLEHCGFTVNKVTYYMLFLFPVLVAMRLLSKTFRNKKHKKDDIPISLERKTIPVINNVFLACLRLEKCLIRHLNLPLGASILVVAVKNENLQ